MSTKNDAAVSRREFLASGSTLLGGAWVMTQWPAIARAAHHAEAAGSAPAPAAFQFFTPAEALTVEALAAQIVPSGPTPGAREAHAVYFMDQAFRSFFADLAEGYRGGLREFEAKFRSVHPGALFAASDAASQTAYLMSVDRTPFFETTRFLTVLGMFSSPQYGGNFGGAGWNLLGFVDQHAFAPPFGYYDRDYAGFVPYSGKPV